jgi:hypothetical protein
MSLYDKAIKNVADAAYKIMAEKLHPNQQKLDVHEPEKDKLTAHDFKKLRSMKKEETEKLDELSKGTLNSYLDKKSDVHATNKNAADDAMDAVRTLRSNKPGNDAPAKERMAHRDKEDELDKNLYNARQASTKSNVKMLQAKRKLNKEETEVVKEAVESPFTSYKKPRPIESKGGAGIKKGTAYGGSAQKSKPEQETAEEKPMKKKKKLSEMVAMYNEKGLKSLEEMAKVELSEEPDNEQFTKEVEDQKASMMGKKKQPSVAAPATQGVKVMPEDYEVIDADEINGVKIDNIQERSLSEPEMKKKEEIVKGMKKGLQGFKDRYGKDAKSVMYATATKQAKGE